MKILALLTALLMATSAQAQINPVLPGSAPTSSYPDTPQRASVEGNASGGQVGAVLNPAVPLGATILTPGSAVASIVSAAAAGTTFYFLPGVYRNISISPLAGDTFIGAPNTVLNGATLLTGWSGSSGAYTITAPQGTNPSNGGGTCVSASPRCTYPYDVFYDGVPLTAVASASGLATHQFYYNLSTGVITIYDNPAGHILETSTTTYAFQPSASNVTISNIVITKYASTFQTGAIGGNFSGTGTTGWMINNDEISFSHGYGIRSPSASTIRASYIHDNGELGIGTGQTNGVVVNGNELSYNNYAGFDCGNECGGMKFGLSYNTIVMNNNVHHSLGNDGIGIWFDVDAANMTVSYNRTHDNTGPGIQIEESCFARLDHNMSYHDAFGSTQSGNVIAGIVYPASHDVDISYNTVIGSYGGIIGFQQNRTDTSTNCGPHIISNASVHDNDITMLSTTGGSIAGLWTDDSANIFVASNSFTNNRYHTDNASAYIFAHVGQYTFAQWQAGISSGPALDVTGTISTVPAPIMP